MKTCQVCGGAIFAANEMAGYAGPICGCVWGKRPDPFQQIPRPFDSPPLTYEDIKRAVREVLAERNIK